MATPVTVMASTGKDLLVDIARGLLDVISTAMLSYTTYAFIVVNYERAQHQKSS
jgi:uncharacterized membrane protein